MEIARRVGVSRQYVWAVLNPEKRKRKYNLSAAVRSALEDTGIALMSIAGVARLLGVHPNTIRRWSDEGLIPCIRLGPRHDRRFDPQLVMETIWKSDSRNS